MSDDCLIVAPTTNSSAGLRDSGHPKGRPPEGGHEDDVPLVPEWAWFVLVPGGLLALLVFASIGINDGAGDGWALTLAVLVAVAALLAHSYIRRRKVHRGRKRQALLAELAICDADQMTWQQFEVYCGNLLVARHYTNVKKTRNVPREKRVDFTAIDPGGGLVAIECKHRSTGSVGAKLAHELAGKVTFGLYKEYAGILMTNASVTAEAEEIAAEAGIKVVKRGPLAQWRAEALQSAEQEAHKPAAAVRSDGWLHALSTEAKVTAAVLAAACLVVLGVAIQIAATPRPAAADPAPSSAATRTPHVTSAAPTRTKIKRGAPSEPAVVVRRYLAAISSHDWPLVWKLGGKNVGRGPYASYSGMVAGYRGTVRDVPTTLTASDQTVSGRFLAYQTDGEVVTYAFTYVIQGGTITSADAYPVKTARYQTG